MLEHMDAREVTMHYKRKGDRVDEVLHDIVLNHVNRLELENKWLRKALGTIVHEIDEALEHFFEENTFTEIRAIAQEALGWEESQMENKATNEELLCQQLERLSKASANAESVEELIAITFTMVEIYKALSNNQMIQVTPLINGEAIN